MVTKGYKQAHILDLVSKLVCYEIISANVTIVNILLPHCRERKWSVDSS